MFRAVQGVIESQKEKESFILVKDMMPSDKLLSYLFGPHWVMLSLGPFGTHLAVLGKHCLLPRPRTNMSLSNPRVQFVRELIFFHYLTYPRVL